MAPPPQQQQQASSGVPLLLGHIQRSQAQQQQQQQQQHAGLGWHSSSTSSHSTTPQLRSRPAAFASIRPALNEFAAFALAPMPQAAADSASNRSSSSSSTQGLPSQKRPQFELPQEQQQQQQQQAHQTPFWRERQQSSSSSSSEQVQEKQRKQHHHHGGAAGGKHHQHHHHQHQQPHGSQPQEQPVKQQHVLRAPGHRHGGASMSSSGGSAIAASAPQFASATISGSSAGGGGDAHHGGGLGRAVSRVLFNGEVCRLLGFVGAQLLVHAATFQRSMHQLHQHDLGGVGASLDRQQQQQQQQHPGPFAGWRLRLPWQRPDGGLGDRGGDGGPHGSGGADSGGGAAWQAGEAARQWVGRGIVAEREMNLREALACYTNAVTLEPGNREYLCRLAKQWSDLTYEDGATVEAIQEVNAKAIEYAERVIAMAPAAPDGYMASCVSRGRLALFSDNKAKVRLAKEAQEAARTAVQLDPSNDLAHHLMGRWHYEMAQINFVLRQLIRIVYGAALAPGTFEDALAEFQAAVALNPRKLIHRVELGRTHLRLGHKRDAYEHLQAGLALEVEDINAKLQKEDAELLLAKLTSELRGRPELPASWGSFSAPGIAAVAEGAAGGASSSSSSSSSSSAVAAAGGASSSSSSSGGGGGAQGL